MKDQNIYRQIDRLVSYGIACKLLPEEEQVYATNLILDLLHLDYYDGLFFRELKWEESVRRNPEDTCRLSKILEPLVLYGLKNKLVPDMLPLRDVFDAKLMNCIMPRPKAVVDWFWGEYAKSPETATLKYFTFSKDSNYIRRDRIARDIKWEGATKYGNLEILISLSKPELEPAAIAAASRARATGYPKCALCRENEGYAGRVDFAARQNHRIIPLKLCGKDFSLQFSPYRYCHQHCIVLSHNHVPMVVDERAVEKILEFVTLFPHYFLGSNSDLPYVGGSVLSHEHFQGGVHRLPIMDAKVKKDYIKTKDFELCTLNWPLSTIRIKGSNKRDIINVATHIIRSWRGVRQSDYNTTCIDYLGYRDDDALIDPGTLEERHNAITPLAYREGSDYVLFIMLRNNKCTKERPDGLFHTHPDRFHIKKEGIGIIDAPGLAILPPRLKKELSLVAQVLTGKVKLNQNSKMIKELEIEKENESEIEKTIEKHKTWMNEILSKYEKLDDNNIGKILQNEIVLVFMKMLEDCAVFKTDQEFEKFMRVACSAFLP